MGVKVALAVLVLCITASGSRIGRRVERGTNKVPRIAYGDSTTYQEFPFIAMVLTQVQTDASTMCGASLISEKVLLTAAHCVVAVECEGCANNYGYSPRHFDIYIGDNDEDVIESAEQQLEVDSLIIHKDYVSDTVTNDIAMIVLRSPPVLSDKVAMIALPNASDVTELYKDGAAITVTGWGTTESGSVSTKLMKLGGIVTPRANCTEEYGTSLEPGMMCSGSQPMKRHSDTGDSGGPLFTKHNDQWVQLALVSWGPDTLTTSTYDVNTNITYYRSWIDSELSSLTDYIETVTVTSTAQTVTVSNPRNYYYKVWHVGAAAGKFVSLEIVSGTLETGKDVLEVFNGEYDRTQLIVQLSGALSPATYTSTGQNMTVIMRCNDVTPSSGVVFKLTESSTAGTAESKCADGFFACSNKEQCILDSYKCNNSSQCEDGSDENQEGKDEICEDKKNSSSVLRVNVLVMLAAFVVSKLF